MELPVEIVRGLSYINDENNISDKIFSSAVQSISHSLISESIAERHPQVPGLSPLSLKISYTALSCLFLESAKLNYDASSLSQFLLDQKLLPQRSEIICSFYEKIKTNLRDELSRTGHSYSHLFDVDWRLDYKIKNSYQGKVSQPEFLIEFLTKGGGCDTNANFQMTFTKEQLQDLVGKLKEACKSLERVASKNN